MDNKISIVIRTYNEGKHIGQLLESIEKQSYRNYELIIVDSGSNDKTLEIIKKYNVNLVLIKKEEFNYSYASNVGVKNSTGDIVCFLSGHSIPVNNNYLETINTIFQNSTIGAMYGDEIALSDGSITEKVYNFLGYVKNKIKGFGKKVFLETKIHPGIFSCNNAAARRNLLEKHPFKIELGKGGEDVEVAYRILQDGYFIAKVPKLLVRHSHGKKFRDFVQQLRDWKMMYQKVERFIDGD